MSDTRRLTKEIAYAYPSSPYAEKVGFRDTGCYFVSIRDLDNDWKTTVTSPAYEFASEYDLIDAYKKAPGKPCPMAINTGQGWRVGIPGITLTDEEKQTLKDTGCLDFE